MTLPPLEDPTLTDGERERLGMVPGVRAAARLGEAIDPDPDWAPASDEELPEGPDGIALYHHPEVLLLSEPQLWGVVAAWRGGVTREVTREVYRSVSFWWLESWYELVAAAHRQHMREMKEIRSGQGSEA